MPQIFTMNFAKIELLFILEFLHVFVSRIHKILFKNFENWREDWNKSLKKIQF